MSISRVKVGLPIDSSSTSRGRSVSVRWSQTKAARPEGPARRALNKNRPSAPIAPEAVTAPAHIASKPLSFLSARNFFVLLGVALVSIFVVGGLVRSNHLAVSHSYEISELTQHKMDLLEVNRQLKTQLARVGSLEHLEKAARESLGLITPQQGQIVVIE